MTRDYYRLHAPASLPMTDPGWRQFRFRLQNGRFLKVRDRISTPRALQKWLVRWAPTDAFYTTSAFLCPEAVGRRAQAPVSHNLFLYNDLVFDLDASAKTLRQRVRQAAASARELLALFREKGMRPRYIAFSGSKGFHVVFPPPPQPPCRDPREREALTQKQRRRVLERVVGAGIAVDPRVTADTRRILRVPGTLHAGTGLRCALVSEDDLRRPARVLARARPPSCAPLTPCGNETTLRAFVKAFAGWLHRWGVRSTRPPFFYRSFLSSRVPGTRLHAPILSFPPRAASSARLKRLQKAYKLPLLYLFGDAKTLYALATKPLAPRRLQKLLKACRALNAGAFFKYRHLYLPINPPTARNGKALANPVRFEGVLGRRPRGLQSRPHLCFLEKAGAPVYPGTRMCGPPSFELVHALVRA